MSLPADAMEMLRTTSRTFYIPISRLPSPLLRSVGAAYLCFRAIDEIEDHEDLSTDIKLEQLKQIGRHLQQLCERKVAAEFPKCHPELPEVTQRLPDWLSLVPTDLFSLVAESVGSMADAMAEWVKSGWKIQSENDLERYTDDVAGAVGVLLCQLWQAHDGTLPDPVGASALGRGLQAVNILNNRDTDLSRNVNFFPDGWQKQDMRLYAVTQLNVGAEYVNRLPNGPAKTFSQLPLSLAFATIDSLVRRNQSLSREEVVNLCGDSGQSGSDSGR